MIFSGPSVLGHDHKIGHGHIFQFVIICRSVQGHIRDGKLSDINEELSKM
jgi:hypothetical protein